MWPYSPDIRSRARRRLDRVRNPGEVSVVQVEPGPATSDALCAGVGIFGTFTGYLANLFLSPAKQRERQT
jgi:hypothetical protein